MAVVPAGAAGSPRCGCFLARGLLDGCVCNGPELGVQGIALDGLEDVDVAPLGEPVEPVHQRATAGRPSGSAAPGNRWRPRARPPRAIRRAGAKIRACRSSRCAALRCPRRRPASAHRHPRRAVAAEAGYPIGALREACSGSARRSLHSGCGRHRRPPHPRGHGCSRHSCGSAGI